MSERSRYEDLELTTEQVVELAGAMQTLVRTPEWEIYAELLRGRRIQYREILTRGSKDAFDRIVGLVDGLEEAEALPQTILRAAGVVAARDEAGDASARRRGRQGLYGDDGGPSFS